MVPQYTRGHHMRFPEAPNMVLRGIRGTITCVFLKPPNMVHVKLGVSIETLNCVPSHYDEEHENIAPLGRVPG